MTGTALTASGGGVYPPGMPARRGFTLIELMIVVAIIGVLASIAVPRFAEMVRKSGEGSARGNLGALRSAIGIYYGDMEGQYPNHLEALTISGKYLAAIPEARTPNYHAAAAVVEDNDDWGMGSMFVLDNGRWRYWNWSTGLNGRVQGDLWIGCTHTDSKGSVWTSY